MTIVEDHGEIGIAWSIMRDRTGIKLDRPATPEDYSDENYAGKVVTPWYRDQNDIVSKKITPISNERLECEF